MSAPRPGIRSILPLACALLVASSGCSMLFMQKASTTSDPSRVPHCTPNNATVILDAVLGGIYLSAGVAGLAGTTDGEASSDDREGMVASTLFGAVFAASALMYMGEADKCSRAIDAHNHWVIGGGQ